MTAWIVGSVLVVLGVVFATLVVNAVLQGNERRRHPQPCTHYHRCSECQ